MSALVQGFGLDRTTERWFLRRIGELQKALASGSNDFCGALGGLDRIRSVARVTLTSEQFAALDDLIAKVRASAICTPDETGQAGRPVVTSPLQPASPTAPKPVAPAGDGDRNKQQADQPDKSGSDRSDRSNQKTPDSGDSTLRPRDLRAQN
jgi:hypothetical protein